MLLIMVSWNISNYFRSELRLYFNRNYFFKGSTVGGSGGRLSALRNWLKQTRWRKREKQTPPSTPQHLQKPVGYSDQTESPLYHNGNQEERIPSDSGEYSNSLKSLRPESAIGFKMTRYHYFPFFYIMGNCIASFTYYPITNPWFEIQSGFWSA